MRGRNTRASTMISGRQFAIGVEETIITFECARQGHKYKIDWAKKSLTRRMGPEGCKMMARWWSREKGGCIGECKQCDKEARLAKEGKLQLKINEEIARIGAVLQSRGVDVDKMLLEYKQNKVGPEDQLKGLVGALYDGLAYGNWPPK